MEAILFDTYLQTPSNERYKSKNLCFVFYYGSLYYTTRFSNTFPYVFDPIFTKSFLEDQKKQREQNLAEYKAKSEERYKQYKAKEAEEAEKAVWKRLAQENLKKVTEWKEGTFEFYYKNAIRVRIKLNPQVNRSTGEVTFADKEGVKISCADFVKLIKLYESAKNDWKAAIADKKPYLGYTTEKVSALSDPKINIARGRVSKKIWFELA